MSFLIFGLATGNNTNAIVNSSGRWKGMVEYSANRRCNPRDCHYFVTSVTFWSDIISNPKNNSWELVSPFYVHNNLMKSFLRIISLYRHARLIIDHIITDHRR